jgi:glyoxylase-like metal-dependent hydrolase (beta-lactamase superfamily II)
MKSCVLHLTKAARIQRFLSQFTRNFEAILSTEHPKTPPFSREMTFKYGTLEPVAPGLRRIVCHNPGPFTFKGTNLYVIGEGEVAVADPGPSSSDQLDVLAGSLMDETITHILITHCHSDHTGAVAALKERTGALACGMPRAADDPALGKLGPSGRSPIVPVRFDIPLRHGSTVSGPGWEAEAIHTPGHAPDHLCFYLPNQDVLLSGDHVMGWNTSVVAPPEGHMGSYMRSLELLMERKDSVYFPGHGGPIKDPQRYVKALIFHRRWRESEVIDCLRAGLVSAGDMVSRIYSGLEPSLSRAAALAVLAQLEFLAERGMVVARKPGPLAIDQEFELA